MMQFQLLNIRLEKWIQISMSDQFFDPDKFNLDKKQILLVISAIGKRWKDSKLSTIKNSRYIISLEAMKVAINLTPEEVIKEIWHDMLFGFNELIRLNDLERMKTEYPDMQKMIEIVTKKLEDGSLFDKRK